MFPKTNEINNNNELLSAINHKIGKDIVVLWHPWTWKTVIAINRFVELYSKWLDVILLCYNKLLRESILEILRKYFSISDEKVKARINTIDSFFCKYILDWKIEEWKYITNYKLDELGESFRKYFNNYWKKFDEIILDEWQDISLDIVENLFLVSKNITILMDELQFIKNYFPKHKILSSEILEEKYDFEIIELVKNYRTPHNIYNFAKDEFIDDNEKIIKTENIINNDWLSVMKRDLTNENIIIEIMNIYKEEKNWIWIFLFTKKEVISLYNILSNDIDKLNMYTSNSNFNIRNNFTDEIIITTYKSAKWLEFNTVIVIIPKESEKIENIKQQLFVLSTRTRKKIYYLFLK